MWIKICGLTDEESVRAAIDAGADAIGFVFFPPSPRHVEFDHAANIAKRARGRAEIVALTVNPDDTLLADLTDRVDPDLIQLHGRETPARAAAIRAHFDKPVMKALPVADATDLAEIDAFAAVANRILLDAKPPKDATRPGGNGEAFDWTLLGGLPADRDYILSGGLTTATVADALDIATRLGRPPWGVDVSSGVESAPGRKDPAKIAQFVEAVRAHGITKSPEIAAASTP